MPIITLQFQTHFFEPVITTILEELNFELDEKVRVSTLGKISL